MPRSLRTPIALLLLELAVIVSYFLGSAVAELHFTPSVPLLSAPDGVRVSLLTGSYVPR